MPLPSTNSDGVQTTAPSSFLPTQLEGLGSQLHDLQRNTLWRYAANPWKNTTSTKEDSYIHKSCQKYHCMMHCQRWNVMYFVHRIILLKTCVIVKSSFLTNTCQIVGPNNLHSEPLHITSGFVFPLWRSSGNDEECEAWEKKVWGLVATVSYHSPPFIKMCTAGFKEI